MIRKYAEFLLVVRWPLFLIFVIVSLASAVGAIRLNIDPTVESLFVKNTPEYQFYREYRERYGSDHVVAVAMDTEDVFTEENLTKLLELHETFEAFPQVERVLSLASAVDIRHKMFGVRLVPALEGVYSNPDDLAKLKDRVLDNELYVGNLISQNGKVATFLIRLDPTSPGGGAFIKSLRALLLTENTKTRHFYIAGSPVEQYDFVKLIRRDQFKFIPMITLLLMVTIFLIYRSLTCVVVAMTIVVTTLSWTFGSIALFGQELNLVTSLLAPVIMIIAVVNAIHFMNLFFEIRPGHPSLRRAIILTMEQLWLPSMLAHLTTIFGFVSLAVNPVPAIRSFGIFAAMGTFYSFIIIMLLIPVLLPSLPYRMRTDPFDESNFFNRLIIRYLERLEYRWKWWILFSVVVAIIASVIGVRKLEIDTNIVKQMKQNSDLAVATAFIDENLTGVYSIGFVLKPKNEGGLYNPEALRAIDGFKDYMEALPEITKVNTITTLIKTIQKARSGEPEGYRIPDNPDDLKQYFKNMADENNPELNYLLSRDLDELRLEAHMKAVGTTEGSRVEFLAKKYLEENLSPYWDYRLTGNVVLLGQMAKNLVVYQIRSFIIAFAAILLIITLIFRSIRMGLLAAIPNLLPILLVYGIMGFVGIELSSPTAMISSIVLGLVVDMSIHFLHRFKHEFQERGHYLLALHHTYRNVGQALVVSSIILMAGFATSVFADFRPTVYFGVLTSLTIFLALICALLVLPVLILMVKPFGPQRIFTGSVHRKRSTPLP